VVDYLEAYTAAMRLNPYLGVSVENVHSESRRWITDTSAGKISSRAVVVATGYNGEPVIPCWPGLKEFPGSMLHSSAYQNGTSFVDQDVLVVGFGNSGGEIALDLMEQGARPTISVRNPVNIIPRDVLGIPILAIGIALSKLPSRLADALSWPLLKLYYPSYQKLGLRKAAGGPFTQIAKIHKVPLLDIGTIREIRNGRIKVTGAIQSFKGEKVLFADGMEKDFQAIVLATGFRPGSMSILPTSVSVQNGVETNLSGLFLCGFHVSSAGMLREIGMEAKRIVASITRTPE
jgi:hypothetical protein